MGWACFAHLSLCLLVSEGKIFKFQPIWNKNCSWRPCLLSNRNEIGKSYRGLSIDASCKILFYLEKWFQRKRFLEIDQPETRIALWQLCLLTDWGEMSNLYRGPSINASYRFQFICPSGFRGENFRNRSTRNKNCLRRQCLLPDSDEISNLYRVPSRRCFLPSFGSFGQAVSEEKIQMWKIKMTRRTTDAKWWQKLTWPFNQVS